MKSITSFVLGSVLGSGVTAIIANIYYKKHYEKIYAEKIDEEVECLRSYYKGDKINKETDFSEYAGETNFSEKREPKTTPETKRAEKERIHEETKKNMERQQHIHNGDVDANRTEYNKMFKMSQGSEDDPKMKKDLKDPKIISIDESAGYSCEHRICNYYVDDDYMEESETSLEVENYQKYIGNLMIESGFLEDDEDLILIYSPEYNIIFEITKFD